MFFTAPYTVTRQTAPGSRDDVIDAATGRPVVLATTTLSVNAYVEPWPEERADVLPEGTRMSSAKLVSTSTELLAGSDTTGAGADRISIGGEDYEILKCEPYSPVLPHWECLAVRLPLDL